VKTCLSVYNLPKVSVFHLSVPCSAVVDSTGGPVLTARPWKAVLWRLASHAVVAGRRHQNMSPCE